MKKYQERAEQARATRAGDVWRHRKTGKDVVVTGRVGYYGVLLSHPSGRQSMKLDHYLASEYEMRDPDPEGVPIIVETAPSQDTP